MRESVTTSADSRRRGNALQTFVDGHLFAWVNLGCAILAAAFWYISDGRVGPWPLIIVLPPWMMRLAAGRFPVKNTRFDPLLLVFLVSAVVAAWAAYDQAISWQKFWLIVGSVVLFYALAGQRSANFWMIIAGLAFSGGIIGAYFIMTHDFIAMPAKVEAINQIGLQIMSSRPAATGGLHSLHPNVAGGIMAMLFPFSLAAGIRAARKQRGIMLAASILAGILMITGLVFTTSRGAWLALIGGLVAWLLWVGSEQFARMLYLTRRKSFGLGLLLLFGLGLSLLLIVPGGLIEVLGRLPGPSTAGSRLEIVQDSLDLVGDFRITGGGLGSFDGLYSQYIRVIPHHALIHGHNLYINVAVEQGLIGLFVLVVLIVIAMWFLIDPKQSAYRRSFRGFSLVNGATLAAFVIMCLHGLVDDPLYGSRGVILLWLPLGLTAFLFPIRSGWIDTIRSLSQPRLIGLGIVTLLAAVIMVAYRGQVLAAWRANLGAIEMARIELTDYPTGEWSDGHEASALSGAKARFERSLLLDRNNRTAWHRLGLIAMLERDYESAKDSLYSAYLLDRDHKGIRKSLMYSYIWTGNISQAIPLLSNFPEAQSELSNYQWWWNQQGFPNLSRLAEDARIQLESSFSQP